MLFSRFYQIKLLQICVLKNYSTHTIIKEREATAHKVVSLMNGHKISHSSAKTRVAYLFSLVIPIYVGKQCDQEGAA